jgi:hypothetical protein
MADSYYLGCGGYKLVSSNFMSRQERRQIKRDRQKALTKETYEPASKGARIFVIAYSLTFIFLFLYLALRDNSIPNNELSKIYVTLKDTPKYDEYKIKSTTYRDIILTTKEYNREFKITGMTYRATDHNAFKSNIFAGDKLELKVKKSELDNLDESTYWNNYNDVYGLSKNGSSYVNIELRNELTDKDSKWSYCFVILGLVMLPYGFIKGKPIIRMDKAVTATAVIGLIIFLLIGKL